MLPSDDEITGGQGDAVRFSRADLRLMRRAARRRWGVPDDLQTEAIYQAADILSTSEDERHKLAAAKLLLEMTKADQRDEVEAAKRADEANDDKDADLDEAKITLAGKLARLARPGGDQGVPGHPDSA